MNITVKARRSYAYGGLSYEMAQHILETWDETYPFNEDFMVYTDLDSKTGMYSVKVYTDKTDWHIAKFAMKVAHYASAINGRPILFVANIF